MTGHQENPGSGFTLQGDDTTAINIEQVVRALGMKNIRVINPNKLDEVRDALDWAISLDEASVIITRWPCALKRFSQADIDEFGKVFTDKCVVDEEKCVGCKNAQKLDVQQYQLIKKRKKL